MADGFFSCPLHGDVAVQHDVHPGDPFGVRVEALDERLAPPAPGSARVCFCGRFLTVSLRPAA